MSQQLQRTDNLVQIVQQLRPDFSKLAVVHNAVNFERESSFALQALQQNDYLARVAAQNPDSLKRAVLNVAAVGLSLSPVFKLAYLVPRKDGVHLEISYRGFIQLATDIGSILWAKAEVVYENDKFEAGGLGKEPVHIFDPFSRNRGERVGGYCVAKTPTGDFLTSTMPIDEIQEIAQRSEAFKKESGPWFTDRNEMIKKTLIRRAHKSWPMTDGRARLDQAIAADLEDEKHVAEREAKSADMRSHSFEEIRAMLKVIDRTEEKFLAHIRRSENRDIQSLEQMTDVEIAKAIAFLKPLAEKMAAV